MPRLNVYPQYCEFPHQSPPNLGFPPRKKCEHFRDEIFIIISSNLSNSSLVDKEFQSETQKYQDSQSKDIEKFFPAPFNIFSAGVPPKEKDACKNLLPTDARETTQ